MQLARFLGATPIIGSASTAAGRAAVVAAGASLAVDHSADDVVRAVLDGTGQAGADVVVEMLMDKNAAADMALVARGGTIAVVGNRGSADGVNFRALMQREARIVGGWRRYAYGLGYEGDDAGVRFRVGNISSL